MAQVKPRKLHSAWWPVIILCGYLLTVIYNPASSEVSSVSSGGASRAVTGFHQLLTEVMQEGEALGYEGRFDRLQPLITSLFDTPLITRVILSRYWKEISEQQQQQFIQLFNHLSIATYASRFDTYNGEYFTEIDEEELNKERVLIKTALHRHNGEPVRMDYLMHRNNDTWQIISVIAEGVNDLSLKRAEYSAVIREKGFDGLVNDIKQKINEMENGTR
jgi:phospholipid transport system substrate-binding protein